MRPPGAPLAPVEGHVARSLRDLTLLADGERGALVSSTGDVVWLCAPRWHDPAVFSTLIGGRGHFSICPRGNFKPGGTYRDGSLIWRDDWVTDRGVVTGHSALAMPGSVDGLVLLRRFSGSRPGMELDVALDVRPDFGQQRLRDLHRDDAGSWTARAGALRVRVMGLADAVLDAEGRLTAVLNLDRVDQPVDIVLELSTRHLPAPVPADRLWASTRAHWESLVQPPARSAAPRDAALAAAVLRGMTSSAGGMVAAATLGLPEHDGGARNYDYRYAWIRDQCYAGVAGGVAQLDDILDAGVGFVSARVLEDGARTSPVYTCDARPVPDTTPLDLPGYPGARAVAGNHARHQFQLDMFGEVLRLLATGASRGRLDGDGWKALDVAVDAIAARWQEPDSGIWELDNQWWTQSRLECVTGLRAAASSHWDAARAEDLRRLADTIAAATARLSLGAGDRWQRTPDEPATDPALLWPLALDHDAAVPLGLEGTLEQVIDELSEDGYAFRGIGDGPLGSTEGAFLLCGFVVSLALARVGRRTTALRWFERNRAACGSPGLFTEEFDTRQRQLKGNLPQAFVHAALLHTSVLLGPSLGAWRAGPADPDDDASAEEGDRS